MGLHHSFINNPSKKPVVMSFAPMATSTPKKGSSCKDVTPPSSPGKDIPSLANPPKAPRRRTRIRYHPYVLQSLHLPFRLKSETQRRRTLRRLREEEREEYESWPIRAKYLQWTPLEIEDIEDLDFLRFLYGKYAFPLSQPRNLYEEDFFRLMKETIQFRILSLKPSDNHPIL